MLLDQNQQNHRPECSRFNSHEEEKHKEEEEGEEEWEQFGMTGTFSRRDGERMGN